MTAIGIGDIKATACARHGKRKTRCTHPLSTVSLRVSERLKLKRSHSPPSQKLDMKREQRRRKSKHTCVQHTKSHLRRGPIITNDLHSSLPRGSGNSERRRLLRIKEETRHRRSTLAPRYQSQFGLFTTPECPVAEDDFYVVVEGINLEQFSSSVWS